MPEAHIKVVESMNRIACAFWSRVKAISAIATDPVPQPIRPTSRVSAGLGEMGSEGRRH